jgi:CDGSH-type Zn-finger protein
MSEDPRCPQKHPHVLELDAGKYAWCACGRSAQDPFCDGSHKATSLRPIRFELDEPTKVALCGCKHNRGADPFCDGSHKKL